MITKKEFYLIRHGQTDYNLSLLKVDHEDVSLNATGFKQAQSVEPIMATLPVKTVCCSPLKRAKETKEIVCTRLQASHYEVAELGECSVKVWNDMTQCGVNASASSERHVQTFMQRVINGINQALSFEGPVLVVAHGGIHWTLCCLMGIKNHEWMIDNCLPVHFFIGHEGYWEAKRLI